MKRCSVKLSTTRRIALLFFFLALCLALRNRMTLPSANSVRVARLSAAQLSEHLTRKVIIPHGSRRTFPEVLETEKLEVGVEVGVQLGEYSKEILSRWPSCRKFYLVDMWRQQNNYNDWANVNNSVQEEIYREALETISPWKEKISVCRDSSVICAKTFEDNYFDFVYLDARHDYKGVSDDLIAWWPKVKVGGIIAGHDYLYADEQMLWMPGQDWGLLADGTRNNGAVRGAVIDFFMHDKNVGSDHYRQVVTTFRDGIQTWKVRK